MNANSIPGDPQDPKETKVSPTGDPDLAVPQVRGSQADPSQVAGAPDGSGAEKSDCETTDPTRDAGQQQSLQGKSPDEVTQAREAMGPAGEEASELASHAGVENVPTVRSGDIPAATASRLGLYLRELQHFLRSGTETIKSNALGRRLGLSDSQIRRDLALFGEFGKRGVGYNVAGLVAALRRSLGTDGTWNTILVGLGNLGHALVRYRGFQQQGFKLQAIFEADATKIGTQIDGIPIYNVEDLEKLVPELQPQMAILAVPVGPAPELARRLVDLGIEGILNFAPVSLSIQNEVATVDVDLAVELQRLAFAVVNSDRSS